MTSAGLPDPYESDGLYFYVSRAYADRDDHHEDPDFWVNRVYDDLCVAVERDRKAQPHWRTGYLDPCGPPDDSETTTARALGLAEVFVPLYSVRYLNDDRPMTHRSQFRARFSAQPSDVADSHVLPVLWEPTAEPSKIPEFREAIEILPDLQEYAEVGLVGLKRLASYREAYEHLLTVFSRRIVDVAEGSVASKASGRPAPDEHGPKSFVVVVLAPRRGDVPRGRRADCYGPRPSDWRPFGPIQPMPVARHAAVRAPVHHLADVVDYDDDTDPFADRPGALLIDPWIIASADGRQRLSQALGRLPAWAQVVVLVDQNDPQYYERGLQLARDATDLCNLARQRANYRRDLHTVEAFDDLIPFWLQLANRRFLRRRSRETGRSFDRKPRLGQPPPDDEEE